MELDLAEMDSQIQEIFGRRAGGRRVALCVSDDVTVPTAMGLMDPAVVIPRWVMEELSSEDLSHILLHELAHLRRWDDWTNLVQKIVKALLFFHPAVWWIEKNISLEREMACDDAVLEQVQSSRAYAECLANLAEKTFIHRSIAMAQAAIGKVRQTSMRVARILSRTASVKEKASWRFGVPAVTGLALVSLVGISRTPRLVAFTQGATSSQETAAIANGEYGMRAPAIPASFHAPVALSSVPLVAKSHKAIRHPASKAQHVDKEQMPNIHDIVASRPANEIIHLTSLSLMPTSENEAVFVVVQEQFGSPEQGTFIQIWHLTVYHPAADQAGNKIPRKET